MPEHQVDGKDQRCPRKPEEITLKVLASEALRRPWGGVTGQSRGGSTFLVWVAGPEAGGWEGVVWQTVKRQGWVQVVGKSVGGGGGAGVRLRRQPVSWCSGLWMFSQEPQTVICKWEGNLCLERSYCVSDSVLVWVVWADMEMGSLGLWYHYYLVMCWRWWLIS